MDEPTTGLDPNQIIEIRNLIKEAGKEKTVILSTHILPEVEAMSDRILIINEGNEQNGPPESLRKASGEGLTIRVKVDAETSTETVIEALKSIPGVSAVDLFNDNNTFIVTGDSEDLNRLIFHLAIANNFVLLEITTIETKLEEIFKELTTTGHEYYINNRKKRNNAFFRLIDGICAPGCFPGI